MKQLVLMIAIFSMFIAAAGWSKDTALTGTINVNTATIEELMLLPGVGEAKAKLIIEARTAKPFTGKEDLLNVKGIGEKMIAQWSNHLGFSGATTLKEVPQNTTAAVKQAQ